MEDSIKLDIKLNYIYIFKNTSTVDLNCHATINLKNGIAPQPYPPCMHIFEVLM